MTSPFQSAMLKLERAKFHSDTLQSEAAALMREQVNRWEPRFIKEFDPQLGAITYSASDSILLPLGVHLGDALTNFRAALDHLAWALYELGSKPADARDSTVYFPVCHDEAAVDAECAKRLPGVDPEAVAIIKRYQPYVRGHAAKSHPLAILSRLVRIDKHRDLHITFTSPIGEMKAEVIAAHNFVPNRMEPLATTSEPLKPGAKLLRVYGTAGPPELGQPDVTVEFKAFHQICLEDGTSITSVLPQIHAMILLVFYELALVADRLLSGPGFPS